MTSLCRMESTYGDSVAASLCRLSSVFHPAFLDELEPDIPLRVRTSPHAGTAMRSVPRGTFISIVRDGSDGPRTLP
jgi:hypothetical protein